MQAHDMREIQGAFMNRRFLLSFIAAIVFPLAALSAEPPKAVLKITIRHTGADLKTFAGQPRVMYIAEHAFGRVEEAPDPEQGIHGLIIVNEPNVWMLNLADYSGRHMVDRHPPTNLRLPIFGQQ